MDKMKPKIKLKPVFKIKAVENGQSGGTPESLPYGYVVPEASADHGNGFFSMLTSGVKRKRVQKSGPGREECKYVSYPGKTFGVSSVQMEEESISSYVDREERVEDEEKLSMCNGAQYMLDCHSVPSKPEEARNTERLQYEQGSLRVKFKTSKIRKISSNVSENQMKDDNDRNNSMLAFSAWEDHNRYVEPRKESYTLASTPEMHTVRSAWSGAKLSNSPLKPLRSVDRLNTPRQMRLGRSSSPHQSELVESLCKSESQQTRDLKMPEGPLKKDSRKFIAAEKGVNFWSQSNKKELEAALMVVKKIMRMEAAEPFNIPVDPVSLGIPDYFDIIDTPMDLGTICRALQKGAKYKTSKDVFHDVELIWDNCVKYNHKGDPILDLMKRVKKNFTKYWTAAGLHYEPPSKRSGLLFSGKVDAPLNIEDGDRPKDYEPKCLSGDINDWNFNDSTPEILNKMRFSVQPSPESFLKSTATQSELTSAGGREKQRNPHYDDFGTMEIKHSSEDSEPKMNISQRSLVDAMIKKKGIKFVIKHSVAKCDPEEKTVVEQNVTPECISVGSALENSHTETDDESAPKAVDLDLDRSFEEETQQQALDSKIRSHRRQRNHRHRPGCLCAVCAVKRRKHAREGKVPLATTQSTRSNASVSQTLNEEPAETEAEQETEKTQKLEEVSGDIERLDERLQHGQEALEAQEEEEKLQEKTGQIQEDSGKESSGNCHSADFKFPLQNTTSPLILKMGTVLFKRWNWPHSLTYCPPRECSDNPLMAAISSFTD